MNNKKKQHYVPKFYLRNFSNNEKINVLDKRDVSRHGASINDVAQEKYFYAVPTEDGSTVETLTAIENYLEGIDDKSGKAISNLLRNLEASRIISLDGLPKYVLSEDEKVDLAIFMIFQNLRTREFREQLAQMDYQLSRSILDLVIQSEGEAEQVGQYDVDLTPEREAHNQIEMLTNREFLAQLLAHALNKHWMIGYSVSTKPLITSDHPVTMRGHNPHPLQKGVAAWGAPFTEITVPLSPKVALLLMCELFFDDSPGGRVSRAITENKVIPIDDENIRYCNHLQVLRSHQYLYSINDEFYEVEELLRKDPESGNPYRRRAEVSGRSHPLPDRWAGRPKKFAKLKHSEQKKN